MKRKMEHEMETGVESLGVIYGVYYEGCSVGV